MNGREDGDVIDSASEESDHVNSERLATSILLVGLICEPFSLVAVSITSSLNCPLFSNMLSSV